MINIPELRIVHFDENIVFDIWHVFLPDSESHYRIFEDDTATFLRFMDDKNKTVRDVANTYSASPALMTMSEFINKDLSEEGYQNLFIKDPPWYYQDRKIGECLNKAEPLINISLLCE